MYTEMKFIISACLIGLAITLMASLNAVASERAMQEKIAGEIIRFHVLANSDEIHDQELKMLVKEKVLQGIEPILDNSEDIDTTRALLIENIDYIKEISQLVISSQGKDYNVEVRHVKTHFPQTIYSNMVLPSGVYEAIQISIGEGTGENWWCVMFPQMCFVESTLGTATDCMHSTLQNILSPEEFRQVFDVRFRTVDWIGGLFW